MSLYRPNTFQVNTGSPVNRTEGLRSALNDVGSLYQSHLDSKRLDLQEKRQAEADARAEQLHTRQLADYDRKEAETLRQLDQRDRLSDYFGSRTFSRIDPNTLSNMNEATVDVSKSIMDKYSNEFDPSRGIGSLLESDKVAEEDKQRIRGMNTAYAQAPSWKENNVNIISKELLREGLVDSPQDATAIASSLAGGQSIEEAVATAQAATKAQNQVRKQEADNAKYLLDQDDKAFTRARNRWRDLQSSSRASGNAGYSNSSDLADMYKVYAGIRGMDIGSMDERGFIRDVDTVRTLFEQQDMTPPNDEELLQAARDTYREGPGLFGLGAWRDRQVGSAEEIARAIQARRQSGASGMRYPTLMEELEGEEKALRQQLMAVATAPALPAPSRGDVLNAANQRPVDAIRRLGNVVPASTPPSQSTRPTQASEPRLQRTSNEPSTRMQAPVVPKDTSTETSSVDPVPIVRGDVGLDLESEYVGTPEYYRELGEGNTRVGMVLAGELDEPALSDWERDHLKAVRQRQTLRRASNTFMDHVNILGQSQKDLYSNLYNTSGNLSNSVSNWIKNNWAPPAPGESIGERYLNRNPRLIESASPVDTLRVPR